MSVRPKTGSKPYRDELRASLQALGAHGPRLTELVASGMASGRAGRGGRPPNCRSGSLRIGSIRSPGTRGHR
jgi:hypothetical protein